MLGHGAGIGYTGPGSRMGPIDNFSLVTGSQEITFNNQAYDILGLPDSRPKICYVIRRSKTDV